MTIELHRAPGTCCPEPSCDNESKPEVCKGCGHDCRYCGRLDNHYRCSQHGLFSMKQVAYTLQGVRCPLCHGPLEPAKKEDLNHVS